ncbi:MAG: single-stranded-DNA-specific exonuclease RecJ, partial [Gammaproteobacteria bacterium]|nr:single-stranded-DNA-specific exonuclease RecJ [Gammaproteobacteria bacterium]
MNLRVVRRAGGADDASMLAGAGLHPVLRRIYLGRGVRTADDLDLSLDRLLPVSTLESIAAGVDLLLEHRLRGRVLVIGDFDADGATSTALVVRALRAWGFAAVD